MATEHPTLAENQLLCGDNLDWLPLIPDQSIDLCYIDPPFFSNQNYEIVWGNSYETRSFGDRFAGGIKHYIAWMEERLVLIHKKLKDTGSFYLHCDWHASHYLKVACDAIFGYGNFRNEIVWCYTGPSNTKRYFPRKHDVILFYVKDKTAAYPFHAAALKTPYKKLKTGKTKGIFKAEKTLDEGGKVVEDWWEEHRDGLSPVGRIPNELIGYKTQKPEALLKRIITASSQPGDWVLDCFAGGGTTAKVAAELGRNFVCGDVSPVALRVIAARLNKYCPRVTYQVEGLPKTEAELKAFKGHDFAKLVCQCQGWELNPKKSADAGIDGWADQGKIPVQIKNHQPPVGRPELQKFIGALQGKSKGISVAWQFSKQAMEYIAEVKKSEGKTVIALPCRDIFNALLIAEDKQKKLDDYYMKHTGGQLEFDLK